MVVAIEVSESEYLRLTAVERFEDGSGYTCRVTARCGEFGCFEKQFYFDDLPKVVANLRAAYRSLTGSIELRQRHEHESIKFTVTPTGRFIIKCYFTDYKDCELGFSLDVDQTYLDPFVSALASVCSGLHA